jgi:hypothetical protein
MTAFAEFDEEFAQLNERAPRKYWDAVTHESGPRPTREDLLDPNPVSPSSFRAHGSKSSDQVLFVPKAAQGEILHPRDVRGRTRRNSTWINGTRDALRSAPHPIGDGDVMMIDDPYVIDHLSGDPFEQWMQQEASHVIAHQRAGDSHKDMPSVRAEFGTGNDLGPFALEYRQSLAEVLTARRYDLGLDLRGREKIGQRESTLDCGVEVATTVYLGSPVLMMERKGPRCPRFDGVGAIVLVGFATGRLPTEFVANVDLRCGSDAWTGRPVIASFIGWCTPDMLYRGDIVALGKVGRKTMTYSALHADDLLPMDLLPAYLAMTRRTGMFCNRSDQLTKVDDWMRSETFRTAFQQTPPWPCGQCMSVDGRIDGAPTRPKHWPRTKRDLSADPDWQCFRKDKRRLIRITEKAVKAYEAELYGPDVDAAAVRKTRIDGNKLRLEQLKEARMAADVRHRSHHGKGPTKTQQAYLRAKKRKDARPDTTDDQN